MDNKFSEILIKKIKIYKTRYPNKNAISILKLTFFLVKSLFYKKQTTEKSSADITPSNFIDKIAFLVHGGLGDHLIAANYIFAFKNQLKIDSSEIYIYSDRSYAPFIFSALTKNIFLGTSPRQYFSLLISLTRLPNILSINNENSIHKNNLKLTNWIQHQLDLKKKYPKYFSSSECDGESALLCLIKNKKRINQPDTSNDFHLTEEYLYKGIPVEYKILHKYALKKNKYITVHRGVDSIITKDSTKLWPQSYYNSLITKLKKLFPEHKVIQLGLSHTRCESMKNIDINLVEKTTLSDIAALLENAYIHIDCEGGLVHLRHALKGGKSVVLFGPTSPDFFGYSENINIRSNSCPCPCEWMTRNWQETCIRDTQKHVCMKNIDPDIVITRIAEFF